MRLVLVAGDGGCGVLCFIALVGGIDELAGDGRFRVVLDGLAVGDGLLHGHLVDEGRDVLFPGAFAGDAAAVAGQKLILTVAAVAHDDRLHNAAVLDAQDHAAQLALRRLRVEYAGEVVDFGQRNRLRLLSGGRVVADFVCHWVSSLKIYLLKNTSHGRRILAEIMPHGGRIIRAYRYGRIVKRRQ